MANKKDDVKSVSGEVVDAPVVDKKKTRTRSTAVVKNEVSVIAGIEINTKDLKTALDQQTKQRELIANFIRDHLKPDIDYLKIHVVKNCDNEYSCKNPKHFSKNILAKPGQEKIFSLFQLTSELERDNETMEMLNDIRNLVAYKCNVKRGDKIVAEGRGAAVVGDKRRDVNATIKIAEKRARMDACLALGFSEYFAQDLDDPDYQNQKKAAEDQNNNKNETLVDKLPKRPSNAPMNLQEKTILAKWLMKRGFNTPEEQIEILAINGINDLKNISSGIAKSMIQKLSNESFTVAKTDTVLDDIDESVNLDDELEKGMSGIEKKKAAELAKEPELVVDAELKDEITSRAAELDLNARGTMWLMNKIAGKPFAKWEKLEDREWRRAYDIVMAILDTKIELDPEYVKSESREKVNEEISEAERDQIDQAIVD